MPFVAFIMATFALPQFYSATFKKKVWRPLMFELTNYVRPFKVIKIAPSLPTATTSSAGTLTAAFSMDSLCSAGCSTSFSPN